MFGIDKPTHLMSRLGRTPGEIQTDIVLVNDEEFQMRVRVLLSALAMGISTAASANCYNTFYGVTCNGPTYSAPQYQAPAPQYHSQSIYVAPQSTYVAPQYHPLPGPLPYTPPPTPDIAGSMMRGMQAGQEMRLRQQQMQMNEQQIEFNRRMLEQQQRGAN